METYKIIKSHHIPGRLEYEGEMVILSQNIRGLLADLINAVLTIDGTPVFCHDTAETLKDSDEQVWGTAHSAIEFRTGLLVGIKDIESKNGVLT